MKKIRKFRIKPRPSAVLRGLKALTGHTQVTPELEKAVESEIARAEPLFATAALYDTVTRDKAPAWTDPLWVAGEGAEPVAMTLLVVTIGPGLEEELGAALSRGEALRSQILTSLGEEAAEQAANFVCRLLGEEAKDESCELSPRVGGASPEVQREILAALDASKVQITLDAVGHLMPRFTKTGYVLWRPPTKKKK